MKVFSTYVGDLVEQWKSSSRAGESLSVDFFWCLKITPKIDSEMTCNKKYFFVNQLVLDHSHEEEGGQRGHVKSFVLFFNCCLVMVSHCVLFFLRCFERFWDLPGGLPGALWGSSWVPSGTTFGLIVGTSRTYKQNKTAVRVVCER